MTTPTQRQVGGDHYTKLAIQPMQYSMDNGLNALQATIIKCVTRYKDKGGIEDLHKAAHCVELLIQHEMDEAHKRDGWTPEAISGAALKQRGLDMRSEEDLVGGNGNDGEDNWQLNRGVAPDTCLATRVIVEYRNGVHVEGYGRCFCWELVGSGHDILRWRLA